MTEEKTIRIGVIGLGGAGYGKLKELRPYPFLKLAAVAEPDEERRTRVAAEFEVPSYADYREMLKRDDMDIVYNATPNFLHAEIACAALKAGKHVFSEKPMALNRADIARMLKAEQESGRRLQINFEMRHSIMSRRIREIIDAGEIGEPKNIYFIHCIGGVGFNQRPGDWRADPTKVGGYYIEEGCHRLDLFRYYMKEDITEVLATPAPELRGPGRWHRGYREPASTLCFFSGDKLAQLINLQHRAVHPILEPDTEEDLGHEYSVSVMGSEGSLRVNFWRRSMQIFHFEGPKGETHLRRTEDYRGIPAQLLHHDSVGFLVDFAQRLREEKEPFMTAEDSWRSMAGVFAAEESMKTGARVRVDYALP